jgi:SAM-dependent methyltransferase
MTDPTEVNRIREVYRQRDRRPSNAGNAGRQAMLRDRNAALKRLLDEEFPLLPHARVLDVGCGKGHLLAWFVLQGASPRNLVGIDLRPEAIAQAREAYPGLTFLQANAEHLPFEDGSFDLVCAFTVFSSILSPGMRRRVAVEIERVLASGGGIAWYDMRLNPQNPHIRPLGPHDIARLFPAYRGRLESNTLAPPIATHLGPFTDRLYPLLARLPMLRSHLIGLLLPRAR